MSKIIEEHKSVETSTAGGRMVKETKVELALYPYFSLNLMCKLWQQLCTDFYLSHPLHLHWLRITSIRFLKTTQYGRALSLFRSFIWKFDQLEIWTSLEFVEHCTEELE